MASVGSGSWKNTTFDVTMREKEVSLVAIPTNLVAKNGQESALIFRVLHLLSMKGALGSSRSPSQRQQGEEVDMGKSAEKRVPEWVGHGEEDDVWE